MIRPLSTACSGKLRGEFDFVMRKGLGSCTDHCRSKFRSRIKPLSNWLTNWSVMTKGSGFQISAHNCSRKTRGSRFTSPPDSSNAPVTATRRVIENLQPISFARFFAAIRDGHGFQQSWTAPTRNGFAISSARVVLPKLLPQLNEASA